MEKIKVLIVDDDIDVIAVSTAILEKEGFEVISASDKIEGYKKAWASKPDLAILDVMMTTHYEGFELAKEFSESPEFKNMPVLMLTSIDVLKTTKPYVQAMAREFRENPDYSELDVILLKDTVTGNAGVDYKSEDGPSVWLPVDGFLAKPADMNKLVTEVNRLLKKKGLKETVA